MLNPATCATRLDLLLRASRSDNQPVPAAADVARALSIRTGTIVQVHQVEAALKGRELLGDELLREVARTYLSPEALFTDTEEGAALEDRLRIFLEIRDRYRDGGVNVIARGSDLTQRQMTAVLNILQRV